MNAIELHNYSLNSRDFNAFCDEKPLSLYVAASKVSAISQLSFSFLQKIYYCLLDLFAKVGCFKERRFQLLKENIAELEKPQKIFLEKRDKLAKLMDEHYVRIAGTVEHLDEAEIIGLGENHNREEHRVRNAKIIDALAESDDLILVEHDESGIHRANCQASFVRSKLPLVGWDDRSGKTTGAAINLQFFEMLTDLSLPAYICNKFLGLYMLGCAGAYTLFQMKADCEIIDRELVMRNKKMCQVVDQQRKGNRRIYIIAGAGHFQPDFHLYSPNSKGSRYQKKMYDQTIDYLKDKKFVLLVPKHANK